MNYIEQQGTRGKILQAAIKVFIQKGIDGARIQEISDISGVNKALIYYYYSSKDNLYFEVLKSVFTHVFRNLKVAILDHREISSKISKIIDIYFNFFLSYPEWPRIMAWEMAKGAENIKKLLKESQEIDFETIRNQFLETYKDGVKRGELRDLDPMQTMISFIGMIIFYFIAKPVIDEIWKIEGDTSKFLNDRKKHIFELFMHGVKK
ncbi:MAG: TetR/AcrR family transcriptional regulator [Fidelibacterota bacterium]